MRVVLGTAVVAHAILSIPLVARIYTDPYPWMLGRIPLKQALRLEVRKAGLGRKQPDFQIAQLLERRFRPARGCLR
jgi:hypothetical protein